MFRDRTPRNATAQPVCTTELIQAIPVTSSHYSGAWDARPTKPISGEWARFVEGLRQGVQRTVPAPKDSSEEAWQEAKAQLPGFICTAFDGRRRNVNAGSHTAIVIDVDDVPDEAVLIAQLQRWQCVAYESPSSHCRGNGLRLRVVAAITEAVPPHAVKSARAAFARELGLDPAACGVDKANAVSQIMFIGRVDGTPERQLWSYDGRVWTPPPPGEAPPAREDSSSDAPAPQWGEDHVPDLSAVANAVGEVDEHGMRRGGRHVSRALGGYLARLGYHPDAIEQAVREQIPSDQPEVRAEQARQCAEQVFDGDPNGAGYTALESHFGEAVMAKLDEATADPWIRMMIAKWPELRSASRPANDTAVSAPPEDGLLWVSAADLAKPLQPVTWLCQRLGLAVGGRPHVFAARAGAGKTMSAQALGLAVATGGKLFGEFECRPGVVRHIDLDQGQQATQRRYQWLANGLGVDLRDVPNLACSFFGFSLTERAQVSAKAMSLLERSVRGADLVIIDALRSLAPGLDENASEFGAVLAALSAITNETGVTWLVLHHSGKSDGATFRGTTAIEDRLGSGWELVQGDDMTSWVHAKRSELACEFEAEFTTRLTRHLVRGREAASITVVPEVDGRGASGAPTADERRAVAELVKESPDGISRAAVEMAMKRRIARDRLRGVIDTLLSDQVLAPHGTGKLSRLIPGPKITEELA